MLGHYKPTGLQVAFPRLVSLPIFHHSLQAVLKTLYISAIPHRYQHGHRTLYFSSCAHVHYKLSTGSSTSRVGVDTVNWTYVLTYNIYRGPSQMTRILLQRDLDQEFFRRESGEYLFNRDTYHDGLEPRALLDKFKYVP